MRDHVILEIHCHTSEKSTCSFVTARDLITRAFEVGMDGIVLTDHHYMWSTEELLAVKAKSGLPDHFLLLSGQEVTTSSGADILVYGADRIFPKGTELSDIRKACPDAAIIWAHPYRKGGIPKKEELMDEMYDAIEILNSNHTFTEIHRAVNDWHALKFTASAGTDAHALSYIGTYPTIIEHPVENIKQFAEEIRAGRCHPYFKEIRRAGTTRTRIKEFSVGPQHKKKHAFIIKEYEETEAWKNGNRSYRIMTAIRRSGFDKGVCRIPEPLAEDQKHRILIEEKAEGNVLFEVILHANKKKAQEALKLAAKWLAKLHNLQLKVTSAEDYCTIEPERINWYVKGLHERDNPHRHRAQEICDYVLQAELQLIRSHPQWLVQSHGDFHLKNIFYHNDNENDPCIIVIDFDSSYLLPQAFDIGTFLAQYDNMFYKHRHIFDKAPPDIFLETYENEIHHLPDTFRQQVRLFQTRTYLSILYYLAKVDMGESENFWTILLYAEKALASITHSQIGGINGDKTGSSG
jgi:thiamine kinase-like enzyme